MSHPDLTRRSPRRRALSALFWAAAVAGCSQLDFPVLGSPVPVSAQTLAVVGAGLVLGPGDGALAIGLYLAAGALGLPVYSDGNSGMSALLGPTGGYLFGFLGGAALAGWMVWRAGTAGPRLALAAGLAAQAFILALGVPWLAISTGMSASEALQAGCWPFLPGMVLKAILAAAGWLLWLRIRPDRTVEPRP